MPANPTALDLDAAVMTCCECGAQMVSSSGIDALSPLVEPYRVRAREAEERATAAESERDRLRERVGELGRHAAYWETRWRTETGGDER